MDNEISESERLLRYEVLHNVIHAIDNDIKNEMTNTNLSKKKYSSFGLLN